jgi:hypothetical protein
MVKVETANQQEHGENSCHQPPRGLIRCLLTMQSMREQMKDSDPQHQAAYEAGERLCCGVGEPPDRR